MSRESFLRMASFINVRYPKATDKFKAERLLLIVGENSKPVDVKAMMEKEYKKLSKKFEDGTIKDEEMEKMSELEHTLNDDYQGGVKWC